MSNSHRSLCEHFQIPPFGEIYHEPSYRSKTVCFKLWMQDTLSDVVMLLFMMISEMQGKSVYRVWSLFGFQETLIMIDPYGAFQASILLEPHFVIIWK